MYIGIDTGGTFTDFVYYDGKKITVHKVLSTPQAPEKAILQGLREMAVDLREQKIVHGSTVATNAVLESKGVVTVYITNRGLADVLTIGRQTRRELYELQPIPLSPPVPPAYCLQTGGRMAADGSIVEPLTDNDIEQLLEQINQLKPQAVAINLLFSFMDDRLERRIEQALPKHLFVSRSSYVLPEYREYERGVATWLNAWVGPLVQGYLNRLQQAVKPAGVSVMQSSGGTIAATEAGSQAVRLLLSGPAGGLAACQFIGAVTGGHRLMSFDMGGTSTDVALVDGDIQLTSESSIAGYPVAVPMVDMHTIGAGGGSIASLDTGGLLQVGPQSAGAQPGPACYGQGGVEPTVTDANVVMGRIPANTRLAGSLAIQAGLARQAVGRLAKQAGLSTEQMALGIIRIANEHMAQALRVISVRRGHDPRDFVLLPFGGAGALHVCQVAELLGMKQALIPNYAGVLSALGMLVAPRERQLSRTYRSSLQALDEALMAEHFRQLHQQAADELAMEGVSPNDLIVKRSVDCRYRGQTYCIQVSWENAAQASSVFHGMHKQRYGHALDLPVECVNLRLSARGHALQPDLPRMDSRNADPLYTVKLYQETADVPVYTRETLGSGHAGPLLVVDDHATAYISSPWRCHKDPWGNLVLNTLQ